jgi:hypothetical protein
MATNALIRQTTSQDAQSRQELVPVTNNSKPGAIVQQVTDSTKHHNAMLS